MTKGQKALKQVCDHWYTEEVSYEDEKIVIDNLNIIEKELQYLDAIDNAKSSESLKSLEDIYRNGVFVSDYDELGKQHITNISPETNKSISEQCNTIKQALQRLEQNEFKSNESLEYVIKIMEDKIDTYEKIMVDMIREFHLFLYDNGGKDYPHDNKYYILHQDPNLNTYEYNKCVQIPEWLFSDVYNKMKSKKRKVTKEVSWEEHFAMVNEIHKIQYIERITGTPILSKYRVNEYDRYLADEGHHINHLSKEAFEYYYKVYEPWYRNFQKQLKEIMTSPGNLDIDTPFGGGADKKGF